MTNIRVTIIFLLAFLAGIFISFSENTFDRWEILAFGSIMMAGLVWSQARDA